MKIIILIITLLFPDGTVQSKIFQAPPTETMEHCKNVVVPGSIETMKHSVPFAKGITGVCFEILLNLTKA
jgi:hypothetical protein|tara:strand:- start:839 stop:1048 length:210 start_codon:yes stop_codon:yes gene_type:complete